MPSTDPNRPLPVPRLRRRPSELSPARWRRLLHERLLQGRRFQVLHRGRDPSLLEFEVGGPGGPHHVVLRGNALGENSCTCLGLAVGTLGTCEHIESALDWLRRQHGKTLPVQDRPLPYSEIYVRYGARHHIAFRPADPCPGPIQRAANRCFDRRRLLDPLRVDRLLPLVRRAEELEHELLFREDARELLAWLQHRHWLDFQFHQWLPRGIHSNRFAEILLQSPPLFQRDAGLRAARRGRMILADPRGLDHAVQAIVGAELLALAGVRRVIVVTPACSVSRWLTLLAQHSHRKATAVVGSDGRRSEAFGEDSFYKICCYDDLAADLPWYRKGSRPDLLILDQVHRLRHQHAGVAKLAMRLESDYLFLLTSMDPATAPGPLLSLVSMADRHREGPLEDFLQAHQTTDPETLAPRYHQPERIAETLSDLLLRRTVESLHQQLPAFLEEYRTFAMTPLQARAHGQALEVAGKLLDRGEEDTPLSPAELGKLHRSLEAMHRAAACPLCVDQQFDEAYFSESDLRTLAGQLTSDLALLGPKSEELFRLVEEIFQEPGISVVVFSQWSEILDQLGEALETKRIEYVQLDRRMSRKQRRMLLDQFEQRPECGLLLANDGALDPWTLPGKLHLVHFDQPWLAEQVRSREFCASATAKQHPVNVTHLLTQGTLEEALRSWDDPTMLSALQEMNLRTPAALFRPREAELFRRMAQALCERIADPLF